MSHVVEVGIIIRDLDALESAGRRLGLELHRGQETYRWYGSFQGDYPLPAGLKEEDLGKCDHALALAPDRIPINANSAPYEVGVVAQGDGTYKLLFDFWGGGFGLQDAIGQHGGKLFDEYGLAVAEAQARAQGWMTERQADRLTIFHPSGGAIHVCGSEVDAVGFAGSSCLDATRAIIEAMGVEAASMRKPEYRQGIVQEQRTEK